MFMSKKKLNELLQEAKQQAFDDGMSKGYKKGKKDGYSAGLHEGITADKQGMFLNNNGIYVFQDGKTETAIVQ